MSSETLARTRMSYMPAAIRSHGTSDLCAWAAHYALAIIFLWFGLLKFTAYEASAIAPLVINDPLISWLIAPFGVGGTSQLLGVFEIVTGLLLAARPVKPLLGMVGGAMAILTFLVTLSFMVTTPGVAQPGLDHSLALSAMPGQFLLKDIVLLAVSAWALATAYDEHRMRR